MFIATHKITGEVHPIGAITFACLVGDDYRYGGDEAGDLEALDSALKGEYDVRVSVAGEPTSLVLVE